MTELTLTAPVGSKWRHKKRGTTYEIIAEGVSLQCSNDPTFEALFEDDDWVVYRADATGAVYVRPTEEFLDGRFEAMPE